MDESWLQKLLPTMYNYNNLILVDGWSGFLCVSLAENAASPYCVFSYGMTPIRMLSLTAATMTKRTLYKSALSSYGQGFFHWPARMVVRLGLRYCLFPGNLIRSPVNTRINQSTSLPGTLLNRLVISFENENPMTMNLCQAMKDRLPSSSDTCWWICGMCERKILILTMTWKSRSFVEGISRKGVIFRTIEELGGDAFQAVVNING